MYLSSDVLSWHRKDIHVRGMIRPGLVMYKLQTSLNKMTGTIKTVVNSVLIWQGLFDKLLSQN